MIGTDNAVWHRRQTSPGGSFGDWQTMGGSLTDQPSPAVDKTGQTLVLDRGRDSALYLLF